MHVRDGSGYRTPCRRTLVNSTTNPESHHYDVSRSAAHYNAATHHASYHNTETVGKCDRHQGQMVQKPCRPELESRIGSVRIHYLCKRATENNCHILAIQSVGTFTKENIHHRNSCAQSGPNRSRKRRHTRANGLSQRKNRLTERHMSWRWHQKCP